ncbi:MAG: hypothetical protein ABEN55_03160, partial [Bradymonadaceae bacterium]
HPALRQLENLSSSRKIDLPQGFGAQIEKGSMKREIQALTRRSEEILARAGEQRHLEWSFQVVRGTMAAELSSAVGEGDLVVAGSTGRTIRSGMRMKPETRQAADHCDRPVLFLQHGPRPTQSIVAVYDGGPESEAVLDAAMTMVGGPVSLLTVLLPAEDREAGDTLQEEVDERLSQEGIPAHYRRIAPGSLEWVVDTVDKVHGDILIQGSETESLQQDGLEKLLDSVQCPVLLIR